MIHAFLKAGLDMNSKIDKDFNVKTGEHLKQIINVCFKFVIYIQLYIFILSLFLLYTDP